MAIQQTFEFLNESVTSVALPPTAGSGDKHAEGPAENSGDARETLSRPLAQRPTSLEGRGDNKQTNHTSQLDQLRAEVGCIHAKPPVDDAETLSTGSAAIDGLLPRRGLRTNAVTEWVAATDGCGAAALSMITAATRLQQRAGPLIVVCPPDQFYPPAAVALGIPADRIIWVRPDRDADAVWAIDQALRSKATAALWASIGARLDDRDARRFQLAAEIGNTPGLLVRPAAVRGQPTFADVRFHVGHEHVHHQVELPTRTMRITLDRCRGGQIGRAVSVQINDRAGIEPVIPVSQPRRQDEAAPMHLASQLAQPRRTARTDKRRRA